MLKESLAPRRPSVSFCSGAAIDPGVSAALVLATVPGMRQGIRSGALASVETRPAP